MKAPSFEESVESIRQRGLDVAAELLSERGMTFRVARSASEAEAILEGDVWRLAIAEHDPEGAAASLMQTYQFHDPGVAQWFCRLLCRWGLDHFYDDHNTAGALQSFELASGLQPADKEAIMGVIEICVYGERERPRIALPYGVVLSKLDPGRSDLNYLLDRIRQEALLEAGNDLA